jgi:hypothetical protein
MFHYLLSLVFHPKLASNYCIFLYTVLCRIYRVYHFNQTKILQLKAKDFVITCLNDNITI